MQISLFQRLELNAARHPDKAAFIFPKGAGWDVLTYQQLLDSTQRFARGLQACSLTPNMRAAMMTPPSIEFFPFTFALLKLGITPVIVDPAIGLKKLGACINESKPDIFIGNPLTHTLRILLGWGKETIKHNLTIEGVKGSALRLSKSQKSKVARVIPNPSFQISDSPAAIIFTSGSTGVPKGVLYTQENFSAQLNILQQTFSITPDEIDLPAFPLYAIIDALLGVTSVIPDVTFPVPGRTNPKKVLDAIQKFHVTNMFASPVVLDILSSFALNAENADLSSLKRVITAGAPTPIQLQENFRKILSADTDLFGIYGATEALPIAKVESREIFALKEKTAQGAGICLGKPVDGVTVRVIEITDEPIEHWQDSLEAKPNVVGEITVQGAAVTRLYIQREDANRLAKIQNEKEIVHRMGDVGYFDEAGRLWYCGRKSHRVSTRTDVMFTEQIENIFNAHVLVYRTALVAVDKEPVLWIELKKNVHADQKRIENDLIKMASQHPQASKIKTFLFMKKFPTDVRHNSKIVREELTTLAEKRHT